MDLSDNPTRRERAAYTVYTDVIPPRGMEQVSRFGVGLVLLGLVVLFAALAVGLGIPATIPSVAAIASLLYVLYIVFDFFGGV